MSADGQDIQFQLDALNRRRQLAEQLAQQSGQPQQQQVVGGRIMDQGLAPAIRGITSLLAQGRATRAGNDAQQLQQQQSSGISSAISDYQNAPAEGKAAALQRLQRMSNTPASLAQSIIQQATAPKSPTILKKGEVAFDNATHQPIPGMSVPEEPKPMQHTAEGLIFDGKNYRDPDGNVLNAKQVQDWRIKMAGDRSKATADAKKSFNSRHEELLASLAVQNVSLPAGLRSKEQQTATLNGLIAKYPRLTSDEIASRIHSGIISLGAEKKETSTAAAIAGKTSVGENELIDFIPKALDASARVPRGDFMPFNKLVQIGEKNISDPDLKELYGRTQAILNAYDVVAARGGTDMEKRRHNREMLETADSTETYAVAAGVIADEARIAKKAARKSMLPFAERPNEDQPAPIESAAARAKRMGL